MRQAMNAEALNSLGVNLARQGRMEEAFGHFERAITMDPGHLEARLNAAQILAANDYRPDAINLLLGGFKTAPEHPRLRAALAAALEGFALDTAGAAVRGVLLDLANDERIATQALADAILGLVKAAPGFPATGALAGDPLLEALLRRAVVNDESVERALTALRRDLLLGRNIAVPLPFVCALAQQCFNNEYAWYVDAEEAAALERSWPADERSLAIAAMYRPLYRMSRLAEPDAMSSAFEPVWRTQVLEPREEAQIVIDALTPIEDAVSREVRAMYEENPYPRWQTMLRPPPQRLADGAPRAILVAGAGTGQHPIHTALRYPESEVLAVDLSRASLAYATRMAHKHGAANLTLRQADILGLGVLERKFDLIESLGVLHHMKDPMAGWRVLRGLLADDGQMRIGLYSERARVPLTAARKQVAGASDIPTARRAILDLPAGHPARQAAESDDFFSASGFRDLVLHVQEHRYTPARIGQSLRDLGLRFLGMDCPPAARSQFLSRFGSGALNDLARWEAFDQQNPAAFRGMFLFACGR